MAEQELRECPFCGGTQLKVKEDLAAYLPHCAWVVLCKCGANGENCPDRQSAINVWNTRATTSDYRRGVEDAAKIADGRAERNADKARGYGRRGISDAELRSCARSDEAESIADAIRALLTTEQVQGASGVDAQTRIVLLESGLERIAEVATAGKTGHADDMRERFQWIKERATELLPAPPVPVTADEEMK